MTCLYGARSLNMHVDMMEKYISGATVLLTSLLQKNKFICLDRLREQ